MTTLDRWSLQRGGLYREVVTWTGLTVFRGWSFSQSSCPPVFRLVCPLMDGYTCRIVDGWMDE